VICSPATGSNPIHGGLSDLLKKYDINDFAASVQVYAVKLSGTS
jgi:arsenite methyltransferase